MNQQNGVKKTRCMMAMLVLFVKVVMLIQDWFDPDNVEHVKAYKHLRENGVWPVGFVPEHITLNACWVVAIIAKLADRWIDSKLNEHYVRNIP
jgi:hypothetical protein